jgi:hypothetical protein
MHLRKPEPSSSTPREGRYHPIHQYKFLAPLLPTKVGTQGRLVPVREANPKPVGCINDAPWQATAARCIVDAPYEAGIGG